MNPRTVGRATGTGLRVGGGLTMLAVVGVLLVYATRIFLDLPLYPATEGGYLIQALYGKVLPGHPDLLVRRAHAVLGGADTATDEGSFTTVLSNIEKVSKVFNYMARIFSSTSAMLNNFITIYNTVKQLNEFIANNF